MALLGLALFAIAGCEAPPQPFEPPDRLAATTAVAAPGADAGVILVPIQGLAPNAGHILAHRIAENLQQREIAASTDTAMAGSFMLQGSVETRALDDARIQLDFTWRLVDPNGLTGGTASQSETAPALALQAEDPKLMTAMAERAAERIEALIRPGVKQALAPALPQTRVVLRPVEGAPGDGKISLTRAIRDILVRNNVTVVERDDPSALLALGTVRMQDRGTVQLVQIEWRVLKPDGTAVGTVSQQNQIPAGMLDGPWGPIATQAASGSADGLIQLLRAAAASGGS
jgi:hypothetical protein